MGRTGRTVSGRPVHGTGGNEQHHQDQDQTPELSRFHRERILGFQETKLYIFPTLQNSGKNVSLCIFFPDKR